jgi:hypothetical protein
MVASAQSKLSSDYSSESLTKQVLAKFELATEFAADRNLHAVI